MYERTILLDIWVYPDSAWSSIDLSGFKVEATDGEVGTVDETTEIGSGELVIHTGPWIFGKKVLLPAGIVESVDHDDEKVFVNRTKDEIENAPEYNDASFSDEAYRSQLDLYYGGPGPTI